MIVLNILGYFGRNKKNSYAALRCSDVVKPLPDPPHPILKEAVFLIKIVTYLAMCITSSGHVA